jgi:hypothetical protein
VTVRLTIELDREVDGRWIAEVPQLNILLYKLSKPTPFSERSQPREIVLDRIAQASCLPIP